MSKQIKIIAAKEEIYIIDVNISVSENKALHFYKAEVTFWRNGKRFVKRGSYNSDLKLEANCENIWNNDIIQ